MGCRAETLFLFIPLYLPFSFQSFLLVPINRNYFVQRCLKMLSIVRKAKKYGFLPPIANSYDNLEDLSLKSDEKFFLCIIG